jgi:hypothetical protein
MIMMMRLEHTDVDHYAVDRCFDHYDFDNDDGRDDKLLLS